MIADTFYSNLNFDVAPSYMPSQTRLLYALGIRTMFTCIDFCSTKFLCLSLLFRFRKQHEQLQQVIMRVLRSQSSATPTEGAELETDDLSAVREVKLAYENVKVVDCLDISAEGNAAWEAALKRYVLLCIYTV